MFTMCACKECVLCNYWIIQIHPAGESVIQIFYILINILSTYSIAY